MSFVSELATATKSARLPFLVIGGQAVAAWGVPRETADFDILVDRSQKSAWISCLGAIGYEVFHDGGNFIQLSSRKFPAWPVYLMLVSTETFSKMRAASVSKSLLGHSFMLPSLLHLIALKLHALKQNLEHRRLRDFLDAVELMQANQLDPRTDEVQSIFEKFGTRELYEKVIQSI